MWTDYITAILAVLSFVCFPFLVIAAAAGVIVLFDRLLHVQRHSGR